MGEFRRASNEFRMQMEDELRMAEQAEQQKKVAEMQAAAPVAPPIPEISDVSENTIAQPSETIDNFATDQNHEFKAEPVVPIEPLPVEPLPIATSGELNLMPPSTGLPVASSSVSHAFDSIPRNSSNSDVDRTTTEAPVHG